MPEVLRQIRSYLPEVLWHIRSYLPKPYLSCGVLNGPMQSYLVFNYTLWYCTVMYGHVRSFNGFYCCITLSSLVLYGCAKSCMVLFGCVWSIRSCHALYDFVSVPLVVLDGPVCSCVVLVSPIHS